MRSSARAPTRSPPPRSSRSRGRRRPSSGCSRTSTHEERRRMSATTTQTSATAAPTKTITYAQAINEALAEEMERDERVFLIGQDVGRMGGIFGVTAGLLDRFGGRRVIDSPISENFLAGGGV